MATSKKRLMVIDGFNQFLRSYIVDPSISTDGNPIGGAKGFLKIINKLCREINPDQIILVWDGENGSAKRRALNKNYKAGRKPPRLNRFHSNLTDEEEKQNKYWQHMKLIELLNETPIMQFLESSVEADDIISLVVQSDKYKGYQKVVVSSDKDFFQLLDDEVVLLRPIQKQILNKNDIINKYGISPQNFALARALAGDKSDNLPGIKGVGLASVAKRFPFLKEQRDYQIKDIFSHAEESDEKIKIYERILENKKVVKDNYKMMQLYSPSISVGTTDKILNILNIFEPEFNKTSFVTQMVKEGFGVVTLEELYGVFRKIVNDHHR